MKTISNEEIQLINGGVVFLIPPAVGGALKVAGFVGAAVSGIGAGSLAANRLIGVIQRLLN